MQVNGIGNFSNADDYVKAKLARFAAGEKNFGTLFELMFSESENVMFEQSSGYRIEKQTYAQVRHETLRLAAGLKQKTADLAKNAIVGIYMENSVAWIEVFWAILRCGFRPLLLNLRLGDDLLGDLLRQVGASAVVSDGKIFALPTLIASDIPMPEAEWTGAEWGDEVLVMSSGTSQHIKVCAYSAEEFYHQIRGSAQIITACPKMKAHYEGELKLLTFLPFYHVFGLIAVYVWFAFFSRSFVLLQDLNPATIQNTIRRHQVTHLFAVPLFWETVYEKAIQTIHGRGEKTEAKFRRALALADRLHALPGVGEAFSRLAFRPVREGLFGESIRFMITGGSHISGEVLSFFNNIGYHLANGYGMTEIGITSVELSDRKKFLFGGYVGKPVSDCEYALNESGELLVKGKVTACAIIENGVRRPRQEWFATGDLACCEKGHYRILTRKDDLVITSNGENLNPILLESPFRLPGIREACLVSACVAGKTTPVLLLRTDGGLTPSAYDDLLTSVTQKAEEVKFPRDGRIVLTADALLGEGDFKLNRRRIAADYEAGRIRPLDPAQPTADGAADALTDELCALLAAMLGKPEDDIHPSEDLFFSLGLSSLEYFALISEIQERYGVRLLQDGETACRTVGRLAQQIKEQCSGVGENL